jgi:hypothetical protein
MMVTKPRNKEMIQIENILILGAKNAIMPDIKLIIKTIRFELENDS